LNLLFDNFWLFHSLSNQQYPKGHGKRRLSESLNYCKQVIRSRLVAQFLILDDAEARKKMKTPADGFSALRRKCLQLGVPLAESRKRKKK
jgi:hypothetical protein